MKLATGEIALTATGRQTTPFPKVDFGTKGKATNTIARIDAWLIDNAIAEAGARVDEFNLPQFWQVNKKRPSQADKDSAEMYLFGAVQPLPKENGYV